MQKKILMQKKRLLRKISEKRYRSLSRFIEDIFLSEYQLKIFMARKCSNLIFAMLPLVQQECGNRVCLLYEEKFSDKEKPAMVSNIALACLKKQIQSGKYKSILLVDDIIIHGRSLDEVYCMLQQWFKEAEITDYSIDVWAYAESLNGVLQGRESLINRRVEKRCSEAEWRAISDDIVNILYLLEQPYTSYVPNLRIDKKSEIGKKIEDILKDSELFKKQNFMDENVYQSDAYAYVEQQNTEIALNCSMRLYEYAESDQYILVPMLMLKPVKEESLYKYLVSMFGILDFDGTIEAFKERIKEFQNDDILYRATVYLSSALWGWKFLCDKLNIISNLPSYDEMEEKVNFSHRLLKKNIQKELDLKQIEKYWAQLNNQYSPVDVLNTLQDGNEDFNILNDAFNDVRKEFKKADKQGGLKQLFGKFLLENSELDEKRYQSGNAPKRLFGYPMEQISKTMEVNEKKWVPAVLSAIDYGKGSIVSAKTNVNGEICFFSIIHSGEQNYKYYINQYFPLMYGLNYIEKQSMKGKLKPEICEKKREDFIIQYLKLMKDNSKFYLESDIEEIKKMRMLEKYREVLENIAWNYYGMNELDNSIAMAKETMNIGDTQDDRRLSENL